MIAVAILLLIGLVAAIVVTATMFVTIYDLSRDRNDQRDRADRAEREADSLQFELNAAMARLSRKRKPSLVQAGREW